MDTGLKMSVTARALTLAVMVAEAAVPMSDGWLSLWTPVWKVWSPCSITIALHALTCNKLRYLPFSSWFTASQ